MYIYIIHIYNYIYIHIDNIISGKIYVMKRGIYNLCGFENLQADASLGLLPTCRMSTCFKGPSEGLQKVPFLVGGIPTPLKHIYQLG